MAIDAMGAYRGTPYTVGGSRPSGAASGTGGAAKAGDVYQELEDYVKMTPAQRMRADLLKKLGLTEEDLAAKSPEEQQAIQAKLTEMIQQQMQEMQAKQEAGTKKTGQWIDTVA